MVKCSKAEVRRLKTARRWKIPVFVSGSDRAGNLLVALMGFHYSRA